MEISVESVLGDDREFDLEQRWDDGTAANSRTLELESWSYVQHQNYTLQLLQKKESPPDRPTIPANIKERLAYFRCYVSSASKAQIIPLQIFSFNVFFWNHIFTLFMKSLPTSYITLFLSSYASRDHLYLPKMVPWFSGSNIAVVMCGVFDLAFSSHYLVFLLYYTLCGLYYRSPWFGCDPKNEFDFRKYAVRCVTPDEFALIFENVTAGLCLCSKYDFHITPDGENIALSPILFYEVTFDLLGPAGNKTILFISLPFVIITIASIHYKALFARFIWRFMYYAHLMVNIIYGVAMVHLTYAYFEKKIKPQSTINSHKMIMEIALISDPGLVSESLTAPPVLHLLTSRSSDQIRPGRDSTMLMASNTIYYVFRGVLLYRIKRYCDSKFNAPIAESYESYPNLYLFPLYFSTFEYGYIYTLIYFLSTFLMELITYIITYQCLLEVIVCEWPKLRKWMLIPILNIIILIIIFIIHINTTFVLYFMSKGITSLVEIIAICWFYPLRRLIDDITFHLGSVPLDTRVLNLKILPFYYTVKIYYTFDGILKLARTSSDIFNYLWIVTYTPISLGFVYSLFKHILMKKKDLKDLLRPIPSFGPHNHIYRQLRKQYDGREYITSQATRYLSRHLIAKSEADTYKLDIRYGSRRSTQFRSAEMHFESDKPDDNRSRRRSVSA